MRHQKSRLPWEILVLRKRIPASKRPRNSERVARRFLAGIQRAIDEDGWRCKDPVMDIAHGVACDVPKQLEALHKQLLELPLEWREHAAAVTAALHLEKSERQRLGAFFTPPHIVSHVLKRLKAQGYDPSRHRVIDPAAGGAAFLAPLHGVISQAIGGTHGAERALKLMTGIEINPSLGKVTRQLLSWRLALARDDDKPTRGDFVAASERVQIADTLKQSSLVGEFDVVIGNPPYVRIGQDKFKAFADKWPDLTENGGYLNLSMVFVGHCLSLLKPGGLLSFVMPAGFIGGPAFAAFRKSIAADVVGIDRIEKRERVFADVIQDCVILTMKRGLTKRRNFSVFSLPGDRTQVRLGKLTLPIDGTAWELPGRATVKTGASLETLGWSGRIGTVVPHRWKKRIVSNRRPGSFALLWEAAIRPEGIVDYDHMCDRVEGIRVMVDPKAQYLVRSPCILVQRTSNRNQKRRINAALVSQKILSEIGPFVGENHVIVLMPPKDAKRPLQTLRTVVRVLNSRDMTEIYDRISGTASVSVKTLLKMKLPTLADEPLRQAKRKKSIGKNA